MERIFNPKCCVCGKFTTWDADNGTHYGSYNDLEPPDPEYYCTECAKDNKEYVLERGKPWIGFWMEPNWNREAAEKLGFVKEKNGWIKKDDQQTIPA